MPGDRREADAVCRAGGFVEGIRASVLRLSEISLNILFDRWRGLGLYLAMRFPRPAIVFAGSAIPRTHQDATAFTASRLSIRASPYAWAQEGLVSPHWQSRFQLPEVDRFRIGGKVFGPTGRSGRDEIIARRYAGHDRTLGLDGLRTRFRYRPAENFA